MSYPVQKSKQVILVSLCWLGKVVTPEQQLMAQICNKGLPCQGIPVAILLWLV